jgi:hypothetical protein
MSNDCSSPCNCGGHVVIQCGCGTSTNDGDHRPPATDPSTPPAGPSLPVGPPCQIVAVRFHSVRVREANGVPHPFGEFAENWELILTANDQSIALDIEATDGADISIEQEVDVELPSPSTTISVRASGVARVLIGEIFDAPLPPTENSHGASDNWGIDAQMQLSASNREHSYTVFYSIKCQIARVSSVFSRRRAIEIMTDALSSVVAPKDIPEDVALTLFIRRMESAGYHLKEIQPDMLVWEGRGNIHRTVQDLLKRSSRKKDRRSKKESD